jgi:hypothetical protein
VGPNTSDGDFSIVKYFKSFRNIRKNKAFSEGVPGDFILYTNAKMDLSSETSKQAPYVEALEVCDRSSQIMRLCGGSTVGKCFQFKIGRNDESEKIREKLKEISVLHELAKKIAELAVEGGQFNFKTDHFKKSHIALGSHVLDKPEKKFKGSFLADKT